MAKTTDASPLRAVALLCLLGPLLAACAAFRLPGDDVPTERDYTNIDPLIGDLPSSSFIGSPPLPPRRPEPPDGLALAPPMSAPLGAVETATEVGTLVGLGFDQLEALLGSPTLQEVQPPAQIWSYNGPDCVLSIFFYPQVGGEQYRALAYEVVEPTPSDQSAQRCFTALLAQNRQPVEEDGRSGAAEQLRPGLSAVSGEVPRTAGAAPSTN
ncbi:hypothetical protein [Algihabitans albus]|uniref:hypothetical protein n=1 Tax=Algihabitans albus TaxID=2164067 RepID=UPI0013C2D5F7|nr:hypothetical protein [Algihabitans albus]